MRCLVVGTDRLGAAPKILKNKFGVTEIIHWDGKKKVQKLPNRLSLILIYTGFANHAVVEKAKRLGKRYNIKTIYINRGLSELAAG